MGLLEEVRRTSGTAPIGTAAVPGLPERDAAAPAPAGDKASLSGNRSLAYGAPEAKPAEESGGIWGSLMNTAKSLWGRVTGIWGGAKAAAPAPKPAPTPTPAASDPPPTGAACLDAATAYELSVESKIQEAKEQATSESNKWDDPRFEQNQMRKARMEGEQRARNAEVPLTDEQQTVAKTFENDEQLAAFKRLGEDERADFVRTYKAIGGTWGEQNEFSRKAAGGLRKLLTDGTLLDKDSQGGTLLATLASHADKPLAKQLADSKLDQAGQLQNIINTVAYPDRVYQGEGTNTCVAASLQTFMAENDPAELARIATGLIYEGEVKLQNGDTMALSTAELHKQDGGRSTTSQLIQGSLREYARGFPADPLPEGCVPADETGGGRYGGKGGRGGGRYGINSSYGGGRYGGGGTRGGGRYGGGGTRGGGTLEGVTGGADGIASKPVPGGVTEYQAQQMFEAVAGTAAVAVPVADGNREAAWKAIEAAVRSGFPIPAGVPGVGANGEIIKHQVTILKVENGKVTVADSGSGKAIEVDIEQFKKDLEAVILPAQFADHTGWNIDENAENPGDADGGAGGGRYGGSGGRGGGRYGTSGTKR